MSSILKYSPFSFCFLCGNPSVRLVAMSDLLGTRGPGELPKGNPWNSDVPQGHPRFVDGPLLCKNSDASFLFRKGREHFVELALSPRPAFTRVTEVWNTPEPKKTKVIPTTMSRPTWNTYLSVKLSISSKPIRRQSFIQILNKIN